MSSLHISEINYKKTCRTCLKQEKDGISLKQIFCKAITPMAIPDELSKMRLKVSKDDGLPQSICNECVDSLIFIHKFRKLCEKSQVILDLSHTSEKQASIDMSTHHELEFVNVGFLLNSQDEIETEPKLEIQLKEKILSDDDVTCTSDAWNQNDLLESVLQSEENQNNTNINQICFRCGQFCSNSEELMLHHEKHICETRSNPTCRYCKEIFETIDLLDIHIKSDHPIKNHTHICPICGKNFATAHSRKIHIESHSDNFPYACDICDSAFKCKIYLTKHKKVVHTFGEHECPHCFMTFNSTYKYNYHLKTHNPNKKYKCKYCDKSFLLRHHHANHERIHTGLKPYLCNICGKHFRQEYNLTLHLRTHGGSRPHVCGLCGKDFAQPRSLILHNKKHTGVRPYQCEQCGKEFYQKSGLNVHLRTHTGERPYKCDLCSKTYTQSAQLKYHKISVHDVLIPVDQRAKDLKDGNTVNPPIKEGIASKVNSENYAETSNESESIKLKETATNRFLFECSICTKQFKLPSSLAAHIKTHSENRKHVCTECGNSFKRAEHLKIHFNGVHLKQKPYACKICHKTFSQSGDRNKHMISHSDEKPHKCPHCSKRFGLQKVLKDHVRTHTGETPYKCEICNMGFITYNAVVIHTVKHTKLLS